MLIYLNHDNTVIRRSRSRDFCRGETASKIPDICRYTATGSPAEQLLHWASNLLQSHGRQDRRHWCTALWKGASTPIMPVETPWDTLDLVCYPESCRHRMGIDHCRMTYCGSQRSGFPTPDKA